MDALLQQLAEAEPGQDARIESQIFAEWSKSGSPAIDLLLQRGQDALDAGDWTTAAEHFTAAIDHDPDFAEAYHGRATAYYMTGHIGPALDDLRQTLVLNPRHFRAMQGFAVILQELDRPEDAVEVLRQVHAMHPADETVADALEQLELMLGGRTL
ncbi:tetratricopeptide repeat protein [Wenxinia marina]|uniref:tetratricopeptide repeat protein n=1 Tax=Wenxinia marina TaxID=390641 RepID=UPI0003749BE5|nr:tetratricopeptide repeat protein [Wenxinia marina]